MASVDNLFAIVSFFALAIFFLAFLVFWNGVQAEEFWDQSSTATQIKGDGQNLMNNFDFILVLVYFGIHLGILVMAFLLRTHPVVYVAAVIIVALLALIAAPISNAYEDLILDEGVADAAVSIPITNYLLANLPMFEVIWGFLTAIIMFGLAKYEGIV